MPNAMRVFPRWMLALLAAVLIALVVGGVWVYRSEARAARDRAYSELNAIGRLKVDQIAAWRRDNLLVAAELADDLLFAHEAADYLRQPQAAAEEAIRARFRSLQRLQGFAGILLIDPAGGARIAVGTRSRVARRGRGRRGRGQSHPAAGRGGPAPGQREHAPHGVCGAHPEPRRTPGVGDGGRPAAQRHGEVPLPLIQSWPTPSPSAETLLVRRDGDDVLFLNELRHRRDAALKLRVPLTQTDVPAVMAVLGREGLVEGVDYRGVPVVSVILRVPDSPWFMVAKVDADEVYADWHDRAVLLVMLLGVLGVSVIGVGLIGWQRGAKRHYRELYRSEAALRALVERHSTTLRSIGDGVIATDARGLVDLINPVAERLTGWTEAEGRGKPLIDVFRIVNEDTRGTVENPVARVLREGVVVALANHTLLIARDGTERPIADSGAPIRDSHGAVIGVVLVFRDQSEQRAHEQELRARERELLESQIVAGIGSYQLDISTGRWTSSSALDTIFGIHADFERSVEGWRALIHPGRPRHDDGLLYRRGRRPPPGLRQAVPHRPARRRRGAVGARAWPSGPGRGGRSDAHARNHPGHYGLEEGRAGPGADAGAAVPGPEDGVGRAPGRRRRPRLQQHARAPSSGYADLALAGLDPASRSARTCTRSRRRRSAPRT